VTAYGSPELMNQGYRVQGNGGAATKSTFNLLNGYVEFDVDVSNVRTGVNANLYAIAPSDLSKEDGFNDPDNQYCDGAINDRKNCIELDWLESNGNCAGATTLHTVMGEGDGAPCNSWGCRAHYTYDDGTAFHMRVEYDGNGRQTMYRNGNMITGFSPQPVDQDWATIKTVMQEKGVLIYGSEWTGWVPEEWCGTSGDLEASSYSISNLIIKGSVVQGPQPTACGGGCPGGSLVNCMGQCPSEGTAYQECVQSCVVQCPSTVSI